MNKRIAIICPYPIHEAPSQRFRFEQYLTFWREEGCYVETFPFLNHNAWSFFYHNGKPIQKVLALARGMFMRFIFLFKALKFDTIFIHREAMPIGPPCFEWFVCKILKKKVIYDFDDAVWLPNYSKQHARFHWLKSYWKIKFIIKWASKVIAGNKYLESYALIYNSNVVIIPTTIDTSFHRFFNTNEKKKEVVIGWTGTHTTMFYLHQITPVLHELAKKYEFVFRVISNSKPDFDIPNLEYIPWKKETEIHDLSEFTIGVMPLTEDEWSKGKCGFKALQYMSLGIPTVASDVGVNAEIIRNGFNGFVATSRQDWYASLASLIEDPKLRTTMGETGLSTVQHFFSVDVFKEKYMDILEL